MKTAMGSIECLPISWLWCSQIWFPCASYLSVCLPWLSTLWLVRTLSRFVVLGPHWLHLSPLPHTPTHTHTHTHRFPTASRQVLYIFTHSDADIYCCCIPYFCGWFKGKSYRCCKSTGFDAVCDTNGTTSCIITRNIFVKLDILYEWRLVMYRCTVS